MKEINSLSDLQESASREEHFQLNFASQNLQHEDVQQIANWMQSRHVEYLSLSNTGLDDAKATTIATAIKTARYLQSVDLSRNNIGNDGALALADAFSSNKKTLFFITHNQIGPPGAAALTRAWASNWNHSTVDLSHNRLGDEGARRISLVLKENPGSIRRLHLTHNEITLEGDRYLASNLPSRIDVCYRVEKISGSLYLDRHPFLACLLFLLCLPLYLLMHCPCIRLEDEMNGLLTPRR